MGLFHKSEAVLFTWDYLSSYTQIHDFIKTLWEIKWPQQHRINIYIFIGNFYSFWGSGGIRIIKSDVIGGEQPPVVFLGVAVLDQSAAEAALGLKFREANAYTLSSDIHWWQLSLHAVDPDVHVVLIQFTAWWPHLLWWPLHQCHTVFLMHQMLIKSYIWAVAGVECCDWWWMGTERGVSAPGQVLYHSHSPPTEREAGIGRLAEVCNHSRFYVKVVIYEGLGMFVTL